MDTHMCAYKAHQQLLHCPLCYSDSTSMRRQCAAACCMAATAARLATQHNRDLVQHCFPLRSPPSSHRRWRLQVPALRRKGVGFADLGANYIGLHIMR